MLDDSLSHRVQKKEAKKTSGNPQGPGLKRRLPQGFIRHRRHILTL